MATCGKCNAELIGSGKFCAACGAPTAPAPATNSPAPGAITPGPSVAISSGGYEPVSSQVNPFAATASPSSPLSVANPFAATAPPNTIKADLLPADPTAKSISRPPGSASDAAREHAEPSQISPLAVSNAHSQRGPIQEVLEAEKKRASLAPGAPGAPVKKKQPGTQMMNNAPVRPEPAAADMKPKKAPARTVAMGFNPAAAIGPKLPGAPASSLDVGAQPQSVLQPSGQPQSVLQPSGQPQSVLQPSGQPQSVLQPSGQPQSVLQPSGQPQSAFGQPQSVLQPSGQPQSVLQPSGHYQPPHAASPAAQSAPQLPGVHGQPQAMQGAYAQAPYTNPAPAGPGGWGWNPAAAPPPQPSFPYAFGYAPGARVLVTWSNGQRYPATVSQINGTQCLVVFPDGQQHWVEMQYLAPS